MFPDVNRQALIGRILNDEPRAPRLLDKSIPQELETIVLKAIAKNPGERYASAQALADDLQRFLDDKPILARRPTLVERAARWRRRHRSVVVSGVVLLLLTSIGLLASTILIAREHADTKKAYALEARQREAAEESFRQARQAVDGFTQLAEQEFAGQPLMQPVRRKFLELTLAYYRNFIDQRRDDSDPTIRAELAATSERVERIVDELAALQRFAPLMLLADTRVQQDLGLSTAAAEQIDTILVGLAADSDLAESRGLPTSAAAQHRTAELLRTTEKEITSVLAAEQLDRLHQIAWQQRGPFAFLSSELGTELNLTSQQRDEIRDAIERTRPRPGGPDNDRPGGPGRGGHGPGSHGPGGPPPDDRFGPEGRGPRTLGRESGDRFGFGPSGEGPGGRGPDGPAHEPGEPRGPMAGGRGPGGHGPGGHRPGGHGPGGHPPDGLGPGPGAFDDSATDDLDERPQPPRLGRRPGGPPPDERRPGQHRLSEDQDLGPRGPGAGPGPGHGPGPGRRRGPGQGAPGQEFSPDPPPGGPPAADESIEESVYDPPVMEGGDVASPGPNGPRGGMRPRPRDFASDFGPGPDAALERLAAARSAKS